MGVMSAWLVVMLLYQLSISFFGFKRNTKNYQDHDPQMRFLVLVPAHNEEAVIADIIDNLEHMEYPRELYDFYILADNCTDRTVEVEMCIRDRAEPGRPAAEQGAPAHCRIHCPAL